MSLVSTEDSQAWKVPADVNFLAAYGHTWSPLHELVPDVPLRHGHAISIDMAYSATLANMRGILSDQEHRRLLNLFSRAGLSMDHHQFDEEVLKQGTQAILKTRDGLLRAAVPSPHIGECVFLNDVSDNELFAALTKHKEIMKEYPRNGEGLEAFVDASDTGYTMNGRSAEGTNGTSEALKKVKVLNDDTSATNGIHSNGKPETNGVKASTKHASGPEGVDGINGEPAPNGKPMTNGHANGKPVANGIH